MRQLSSESEGSILIFSPELIEYATDKTYPVDYRTDIFQLGRCFDILAREGLAGVPSQGERSPGGG